jgi:hypothetical protein
MKMNVNIFCEGICRMPQIGFGCVIYRKVAYFACRAHNTVSAGGGPQETFRKIFAGQLARCGIQTALYGWRF